MSVVEYKDDLNPWTAFSSQIVLDTLAEESLDIQLQLEDKSAFTETEYRGLQIWL